MGPDIVALFREEGGEVIADIRDLRQPGACEALIVEAGHVDVLMLIFDSFEIATADNQRVM